ncbi:MAG: MMPL family transporter, partial [Calditrichaeota bacterium]|nr:MMPL family transporter [Calditrichota bacterium]
VVLPFSVVALTIIWTMGLMGHIGLPLTVVSSALPMLLVAVSSSYGIHVVHRYYEEVAELDKVNGTRRALEKIGPAIILTGLTSALGSATLIVFRVTSIREFGIITALGIIATLFITLTFIPAFLSILKKAERKKSVSEFNRGDRILLGLANFSLRKRGWVIGVSLALVLIAILGIMRIKVGSDFITMFPEDHPIRETFSFFNEKLGGSRYMNIMIEGDKYDAIKNPELLKKVVKFQEYADGLKGVGYSSSFADVIKRMNLVMHGDNPEFERIPESRKLIAQYLLLYSMSGDPGDFDDLVDYDYQRAKIRVNITTSEQEDHRRLHSQFSEYFNREFKASVNSEFGGTLMVWLAQIRYIAIGKVMNIIFAVLLVFLFCALIFRSFIGGLFTIAPLTVATLLTFGLMGFLGIRLDMGTAIITAIAVGIGVDFAIHYISRFREEMKIADNVEQAVRNTILTTGRAIIYDVLSNLLGFIVFIFSGFKPIQYFGWLISLTMITVCFGTLVIMPTLFSLFDPKFARKKALVFQSEAPDDGLALEPAYVRNGDEG